MPSVKDQFLPILLQGAADFAVQSGIPLKQLSEQAQLAAYRSAKRRGWTLDQTAQRFDVSRRKVANLSRSAKDTVSAIAEGTLARRIEFALFVEPRTEAGIRKAFADEEASAVRAALRSLVARGAVEETSDRTARFRLLEPPDDASRRLQAAGVYMNASVRALVRRLVHHDPKSGAGAIHFRLLDEDIGRLAEARDELEALLIELDARAAERAESKLYSFCLGWTEVREIDEAG